MWTPPIDFFPFARNTLYFLRAVGQLRGVVIFRAWPIPESKVVEWRTKKNADST